MDYFIDNIIYDNFSRLNIDKQLEYIHTSVHSILDAIINLNAITNKDKLRITWDINLLNSAQVDQNYIEKFESTLHLYKIANENSDFHWKQDASFKNFTHSLMLFYKEFLDYARNILNVSSVQTGSKNFVSELYSQIPEIDKFKVEINNIELVKSAYIHGSLSTLDYTAFSDFDTFIILDDRIFEDTQSFVEDIKKLYKASSLFYIFDPYQHHRYFFAIEKEISVYNNSFLPTNVFNDSTCLKGEIDRIFNTYNADFSHKLALKRVLQMVESLHDNYINKGKDINLWKLKGFLSYIFLIPSLYLETIGICPYKKESFVLIEKYFPTKLNEYINFSSSIRANWQYKLTYKEKILRWVFLKVKKAPLFYEYLMCSYSPKVKTKDKLKILDSSLYFQEINTEIDQEVFFENNK